MSNFPSFSYNTNNCPNLFPNQNSNNFNNFNFQSNPPKPVEPVVEEVYILYKTTDKGKINVGYFKDVKDIFNHFNNHTYNLDDENIKWFEVDKINLLSKNIDNFILTNSGYFSVAENKVYSYSTIPQNSYVNLMTKIENRKIIKEIKESIEKIEKKINNAFLYTNANNTNQLKELSYKLVQFEKRF